MIYCADCGDPIDDIDDAEILTLPNGDKVYMHPDCFERFMEEDACYE